MRDAPVVPGINRTQDASVCLMLDRLGRDVAACSGLC